MLVGLVPVNVGTNCRALEGSFDTHGTIAPLDITGGDTGTTHA